MLGISAEDKYLIKSLPENKKYGAKRLLKMSPNKNWSLGGLKALIKKLTTRVLLFDVSGSGRHRTVRTVPVLSIFWSSNWLLRLDVIKENKRGCFFWTQCSTVMRSKKYAWLSLMWDCTFIKTAKKKNIHCKQAQFITVKATATAYCLSPSWIITNLQEWDFKPVDNTTTQLNWTSSCSSEHVQKTVAW